MGKLRKEREEIDEVVRRLEERVREANERRSQDEGRGELIAERLVLVKEVGQLRKELDGYKDWDPGEVERKRREIAGLKVKAERWTDNIMILEGYLGNLMGADWETMDMMRRELYGDEYVEGEGLREL